MSRAGNHGIAALERAGAETLKRAVQLDEASRFQESLVCYQEGIDLLLQATKGTGPGAAAGARGGPGDTRAVLEPGVPRGGSGAVGRSRESRAGQGSGGPAPVLSWPVTFCDSQPRLMRRKSTATSRRYPST